MKIPFGDILFRRISGARGALFLQGESAQLTYQSFIKYIEDINKSDEQKITINYPIAYKPDGSTVNGHSDYTKERLIERYQYLAHTQLSINGIYQLVTVIETLLNDILREVLMAFPNKMPSKKKLDYDLALNAKSLEELKMLLINSIINEVAYKSPKDYCDEFKNYTGVNLLENPAYHRFTELKATRDIYIHNQGFANDIYVGKADSQSRVKTGEFLPVNIQYFLQSYEVCLQITEFIDKELDKIWPSQEYQESKSKSTQQEKEEALINAFEESAIIDVSNEPENAVVMKKIRKPRNA